MIKAIKKIKKSDGTIHGLFKTNGGEVYSYSFEKGKLTTDCKDKEVIKALKERLKLTFSGGLSVGT
jgi:hypothetical protein